MKNLLVNSWVLFLLFAAKDKLRLSLSVDQPVQVMAGAEGGQTGNSISNCYALQPIRNKIRRSDSSLVLIKVLHIGDSHVKSGFFSESFMEKLNSFCAKKYRGNVFFNFQVFCKIGTKYADYNGLAELNSQLVREQPDLVIISLGTNDAFSGSSRVKFYEKIDHLVAKINSLSPNAAILLTTPSDALRKQPGSGVYSALPELQFVVDVIIKYANDHRLAYWNLYQVMGGSYSVNGWYQRKMAEPDRVHFTAKGYRMFADWLFQAFSSCLDNQNPPPRFFHF